MTVPLDISTRLLPSECKYIQQLLLNVLFFTHSLDTTMLSSINNLSEKQENRTRETSTSAANPLNYMLAHPNEIILFITSNIITQIYSNTSYLLNQRQKFGLEDI